MPGDTERELKIAVAEGALALDEVEALAMDAERANRNPLSLLVERGQLSPDSMVSLRALARGESVTTATTAERVAPPEFPIRDREHYTCIRFLGQGGMGQVFLARDNRLHRDVAIKFVRGDDRGHVHRLIDEARAQARVDHDRVCKVHEVGEIAGTVYIAMPYLAGRPFAALIDELTLREKVVVIRDAAEGLHAAHRAGIIHRDVKPSNLIVERGDDDAPRVYLVDFGLARRVGTYAPHAEAIVGTPPYMAPEQASGGEVDHRADIYGLGATLYHAITGQSPVTGATTDEVLQALATRAPTPPRALDPTIPVDLEAIVIACLTRDRDRRYASARALANDLNCFLAGEPVVARAAGAWYRLRKRLARHRRAALALAVALTVALVATIWAVVARSAVEVRARAVRRFTERVEAIEAAARFSALSPSHDLHDDRVAIRAQLAALEREVRAAGADLAGAGESALGRGYLAIEDDARAVEHLQAAWQRGFREPRAALALGVALDHLYQQQRRTAERIGSTELRDSRVRALDRQYRAPVLAALAASRNVDDVPAAYLDALAAATTATLDQALRYLAAIERGRPWFFEAEELRGDVLLARAQQRLDHGDMAGARADLAAGRLAYAAAGAIAHSRPAIFVSLAELESTALRMELYGHGDVAAAMARVRAATAQVLALVADHTSALMLEASAYRSLAEDHTNHGRDAEAAAALDRALAAARRAIAAAPEQPDPRFELSRIYREAGERSESQHHDPSDSLRAAVEAAEGVRAADRDAAYFDNLGLIFGIWADYQDDAGQDAGPARTRSLDAYQRAVDLDDRLSRAWINLGIGRVMRASTPRASSRAADLDAALTALEHGADNVVAVFYRGEVHRLRSELVCARGDDAGAELAAALAEYRRGAALDPKLPHLYNGIGTIQLMQARDAWEHAADPDLLLDQARAAFQQAIDAAPDQGFAYSNVGDALALRAEFQYARGEDPRASVRGAIVAMREALQRIPDLPTFHANLALVLAIGAEDDLDHHRDPQRALTEALAAARRALAGNPSGALAHEALGEVLGLVARRDEAHGWRRDDAFANAASELSLALEISPGDFFAPFKLAETCRAWAHAARDPEPVVERGLAAVAVALAIRPASPDARMLRAQLRARQSELTSDEHARRVLADLAAADTTDAITRQPRLAARGSRR